MKNEISEVEKFKEWTIKKYKHPWYTLYNVTLWTAVKKYTMEKEGINKTNWRNAIKDIAVWLEVKNKEDLKWK